MVNKFINGIPIEIDEVDADKPSNDSFKGAGRAFVGSRGISDVKPYSEEESYYGTGRMMYGLEGECCMGGLAVEEDNVLLDSGFSGNLGDLEGFSSKISELAKKSKAPWMFTASAIGGRTSSSALTRAKLHHPVSIALSQKAAEVIKGGFVGGKIGKAAKAAQTTMFKRADLFKKLIAASSRAGSVEEAVDFRNKANLAAAGIIKDRARIERFRYVSVLKTAAVMKREHEDYALRRLRETSDPVQRAKLRTEAKAAAELSKKYHATANHLLTSKLHVEGMAETIKVLQTPRKAHQFGPAAQRSARACAKQVVVNHSMPYWTGMEDVWDVVSDFGSDIVDFAADAAPALNAVAKYGAIAAEVAGTAAMFIPGGQLVAPALAGAAIGLNAAAKFTDPAAKVAKTAKDVKDSLKGGPKIEKKASALTAAGGGNFITELRALRFEQRVGGPGMGAKCGVYHNPTLMTLEAAMNQAGRADIVAAIAEAVRLDKAGECQKAIKAAEVIRDTILQSVDAGAAGAPAAAAPAAAGKKKKGGWIDREVQRPFRPTQAALKKFRDTKSYREEWKADTREGWQLVWDALTLFDAGKVEDAKAKWDKAVGLRIKVTEAKRGGGAAPKKEPAAEEAKEESSNVLLYAGGAVLLVGGIGLFLALRK